MSAGPPYRSRDTPSAWRPSTPTLWDMSWVIVEPVPEGEGAPCDFTWRPRDCNEEPCGDAHGRNVFAKYIEGESRKTPRTEPVLLRDLMARHGMLRDSYRSRCPGCSGAPTRDGHSPRCCEREALAEPEGASGG